MNLDTLPEEVLFRILKEVYPPWYIEAKGDGKSGPAIVARPQAPSLSPLLTSRTIYRVGRDMPLRSFIGLLDGWPFFLQPHDINLGRWNFVLPFVREFWVSNVVCWRLPVHDFPSLRRIQVFSCLPSVDTWNIRKPSDTLDVFPSPSDCLSRHEKRDVWNMQRFLQSYEERWHTRIRVYYYLGFRHETRASDSNQTESADSRMEDSIHIYEITDDPENRCNLLGYQIKPESFEGSHLSWINPPARMSRGV